MYRMIKLILLFMSVFLTQQSCEKVGLCDDDELGFPRQSNVSNKIRLDGFYYGDLTGDNPNSAMINLLYQNGISYIGLGSYDLVDIEDNSFELSISDDKKKEKSGWGVYRVEGDRIEIQNWTFSTGCKPVTTQKGVILNDTTIKIVSWQNSNSDMLHSVNAIFRFHKHTSKPDSTNSLVK